MQLDSCFNLTDYYSEVPTRTNVQSRRWLIQSKFETPVLNFANASYTKTVPGHQVTGLSDASQINIQGIDSISVLSGGTAEAAAKLVEKSGGKVAGFIFVINLFDLGGIKKLEDKGYTALSLIQFPGH